ncbi:hypothetical protein Fmac_005227 [Flemingia macrophylla]|uniref:Uncharacterized protein n=1 Tax=Flemingia macrophylla TaxID=520843 RepID=A0ABD1N770_9FABA
MVSPTVKIIGLIFFLGLINQGYSNCISVSQVGTGVRVEGKPEWIVTVSNNCRCPQSNVILNCNGFRSVEPIDPQILTVSLTNDFCIVTPAQPIFKDVVKFKYASPNQFPLTPISSVDVVRNRMRIKYKMRGDRSGSITTALSLGSQRRVWLQGVLDDFPGAHGGKNELGHVIHLKRSYRTHVIPGVAYAKLGMNHLENFERAEVGHGNPKSSVACFVSLFSTYFHMFSCTDDVYSIKMYMYDVIALCGIGKNDGGSVCKGVEDGKSKEMRVEPVKYWDSRFTGTKPPTNATTSETSLAAVESIQPDYCREETLKMKETTVDLDSNDNCNLNPDHGSLSRLGGNTMGIDRPSSAAIYETALLPERVQLDGCRYEILEYPVDLPQPSRIVSPLHPRLHPRIASPEPRRPLYPCVPDLKRLQIQKLPDEPRNCAAKIVGERVHHSEVPELGEAHRNLSAEVVDGQTVPVRGIQVQNMDMPLEQGRLVEEKWHISSTKNGPSPNSKVFVKGLEVVAEEDNEVEGFSGGSGGVGLSIEDGKDSAREDKGNGSSAGEGEVREEGIERVKDWGHCAIGVEKI